MIVADSEIYHPGVTEASQDPVNYKDEDLLGPNRDAGLTRVLSWENQIQDSGRVVDLTDPESRSHSKKFQTNYIVSENEDGTWTARYQQIPSDKEMIEKMTVDVGMLLELINNELEFDIDLDTLREMFNGTEIYEWYDVNGGFHRALIASNPNFIITGKISGLGGMLFESDSVIENLSLSKFNELLEMSGFNLEVNSSNALLATLEAKPTWTPKPEEPTPLPTSTPWFKSVARDILVEFPFEIDPSKPDVITVKFWYERISNAANPSQGIIIFHHDESVLNAANFCLHLGVPFDELDISELSSGADTVSGVYYGKSVFRYVEVNGQRIIQVPIGNNQAIQVPEEDFLEAYPNFLEAKGLPSATNTPTPTPTETSTPTPTITPFPENPSFEAIAKFATEHPEEFKKWRDDHEFMAKLREMTGKDTDEEAWQALKTTGLATILVLGGAGLLIYLLSKKDSDE